MGRRKAKHPSTEFGRQLRYARQALGIDQLALARIVGVDRQSVSNWECGRNTPWKHRQEHAFAALRSYAGKRVERLGQRARRTFAHLEGG